MSAIRNFPIPAGAPWGKGIRGRSGYTLLELCIVLAIAAVVAAAALPTIRKTLREEPLWSAARDIRAAALAGRRQAVQSGQPCKVLIGAGRVQVRPAAHGSSSDDSRLDREVRVNVWDASRRCWAASSIEWVFQPSGVCDSMRLRIQSADGWIEQEFSPLTAMVEEETWNFF